MPENKKVEVHFVVGNVTQVDPNQSTVHLQVVKDDKNQSHKEFTDAPSPMGNLNLTIKHTAGAFDIFKPGAIIRGWFEDISDWVKKEEDKAEDAVDQFKQDSFLRQDKKGIGSQAPESQEEQSTETLQASGKGSRNSRPRDNE